MVADSLNQVVLNGLCSGCGLCESMAGRDAVAMKLNAAGYLRPHVKLPLLPVLERRILACCPGVTVSGPEGRAAPLDDIWGPVHGHFNGHAGDEILRHQCSSGGVLTALCIDLLERGVIDAVLHVAADPARPMRSVAQVSRSATEITAASGSRYNPAAPLTELCRLAREGTRFLLVAKPCDVAAAREAARGDPSIARTMVGAFAVLCGGVSSHRISSRVAAKYGVTEADIRLMRYRGHGCPGPLRIEHADGRSYEQSYEDTWNDELNTDVQFRCRICPDAIGESADIACGDAWVPKGDSATGAFHGYNAVIARTTQGLAWLLAACDNSALRLTASDLAELNLTQPHHVALKKEVGARLVGLAASGCPTLRARNLRLRRLSRGLSVRAFFRAAVGTWRRVRNGRNREPLPREPSL